MRRLVAAAIDFTINYILSVIVYCVMISIWKWFEYMQGVTIGDYPRMASLGLFLAAYLVCNVLYFFLFASVTEGCTFGKRLAGCRSYVKVTGENKYWKIKYVLLRTIASLLYAITALYYIVTLRMPYDKLEERYIIKEETPGVPKRTGITKRLVAFLIDYIIMGLLYMLIAFLVILGVGGGMELLFKKLELFFAISMCVTFIYMFLYFLVTDYVYKGSSVGKRIVGIRLVSDKSAFRGTLALKHSLLKLLACCIWPVSLIPYLSKGVVFYDKWLGVKVLEEKRD